MLFRWCYKVLDILLRQKENKLPVQKKKNFQECLKWKCLGFLACYDDRRSYIQKYLPDCDFGPKAGYLKNSGSAKVQKKWKATFCYVPCWFYNQIFSNFLKEAIQLLKNVLPKHMICYWQFLIFLPLFIKKFLSFMICRITLMCMFLHGFYCIMIEQAFSASTFYQQSLSLFVLIFRWRAEFLITYIL